MIGLQSTGVDVRHHFFEKFESIFELLEDANDVKVQLDIVHGLEEALVLVLCRNFLCERTPLRVSTEEVNVSPWNIDTLFSFDFNTLVNGLDNKIEVDSLLLTRYSPRSK